MNYKVIFLASIIGLMSGVKADVSSSVLFDFIEACRQDPAKYYTSE